MGAIVVILICSGDLPRERCTEATARVVASVRIDQVVCGVGALAAPARMDIGANEFQRVICKMR